MSIRKKIFLFSLFIIVKSCEDEPGLKSSLNDLKSRYFKYKIGDKFDVRTNYSKSTLTVHAIEGNDDCIGLTTRKKQIIVLQCSGKQQEEPGCFDIISPKSPSQNSTQITSNKKEKICGNIFKLDIGYKVECVIGLRINDNSTIVLAEKLVQTLYPKSVTSNIPYNEPPERMK